MRFAHRSRKNAHLAHAAARGRRRPPKNRATRLRVEPLERRLLLAAVPMTLRITELLPHFTPDDFPLGGDGDFYAEVTIGNRPERSTENFVGNPVSSDHLFNPPFWSFTEFIDPAEFELGLIPVQIQIFDSDVGNDDSIDITAEAGNTLSFLFASAGSFMEGQAVGTSGDSATIKFEMFNSTQVSVFLTEFDEIDDPDPEPGGGEYKFLVKIGDNTEHDTGDNITFPPGNFGTPGLTFTDFVNPANPVIRIRIVVEDSDLAFNDTMDINPRSGTSWLGLDYNITTATWAEAGGAFAFPQNFSQGDGDDDRGKITFNIGPSPDTDGDGLFDIWETQGIDANGDGVIDLVLNTNPQHKDLFVEIDAMQSFVPQAGALADVVAVFASAPVDNPDGVPGVTLHTHLDETNIPNARWIGPNGVWPPEFDLIKQNINPLVAGGFGTVADRASPNAANILAAKRLVNRYCIFADQYGQNGSGGIAELPGNDLIVTLGIVAGGSREEQAGTFMHELGHTIGLSHGGPLGPGGASEPNYKPNYHSLMNYIWSYRYFLGLNPTAQEQAFHDAWALDYSRVPFNDLNENALDEAAGIGGHPGHVTQAGPVLNAAGTLVGPRFVNETGPVDWNGDGVISTAVSDVNFFTDNNNDGTITPADATPGDTLAGQEDWSKLIYNFRGSSGFADATHPEVEDDPLTVDILQDLNQMLYYAAPTDGDADDLTLRRSGDVLEIFDNNTGQVVESRALANTRLVHIRGTAGEDDTLSIDFGAGGYFSVPGGIEFLGGDGASDSLRVIGTGLTSSAYTPNGVTPGNGTATVSLGAESVTVAFTGLEPVEVSGMATLTMTTPNSADVLTLSGGLASGGEAAYVAAGTSGGVAMESLTFFDVGSFTLDAAANDGATPSDSINVNLGAASAGVANVNVSSGAGDDAITVTASAHTAINIDAGTGTADGLRFFGESLTYALTSSSFTTATRQPVVYAGVETVSLFSGVYHATGSVIPNVVVESDATLGGNGTVQGSVTVNTGGTVDPGIGGPGILGTGNVAFTAGGAYQVQLNGLTAGTQHDQLRVSGSVDLGGATLTGSLGFNAVPGDEIVILTNDGSDPIVGEFAAGPGDVVTIGGERFAIDYAFDGDGDGQFNDVALIRYGAELAADPCDPDKTALFVSGTTGDDTIRFISAPGNSGVQVLINGVDEGTFDPSGLLIGFGQSGNDTISVEMPSKDAWLYGQGGDDTLVTGSGDSILLGGLGNDHLTSDGGKDILIGGAGADQLTAGNGDDLLIAGFTAFDSNNAANRHALCHIQEEWLHGSGGYAGRIEHLRFGGGRNGTTVLNATTVLDDTDVDELFGGNGNDWFLMSLDGGVLDIADLAKHEIATAI